MRRLWLLVLLLPIQGEETDFDDHLQDFNRKYQSFVLEYLGCSQHARVNDAGIPQDCVGGGTFDLKRFNAAKKAAEKLFDLVPAP